MLNKNYVKRTNVFAPVILNNIKNKPINMLAVSWIICSLSLALINAYWATEFNFDDVYLIMQFDNMSKHYGFLKSLTTLGLNLNLPEMEFRTYGFSKIIHFLIFQLLGDNPSPYYFVMTITHMCMGFVVYKILKRLKIALYPSLFAVAAFAINPATMQCTTFHEYSYLNIHLYFLLFYIYFQLKYLPPSPQTNAPSCRNTRGSKIFQSKDGSEIKQFDVKPILISILTLSLCVYTGENLLGTLGTVIVIFIIYGICQKNKYIIFTYTGYLVLEAVLVITSYLFYKNNIVNNNRFVKNENIDWIHGLETLFHAVAGSLKEFLFIPTYEKNYKGYIFSLVLNTFSPLTIFFICGSFMLVAAAFIKVYKTTPFSFVNTKASAICICIAVAVSLSAIGVYGIMTTIITSSRPIYHYYFHAVYAIWASALIIVLNSLLKEKVFIFVSSLIICIFGGYNIIWFGSLIPDTAYMNMEIRSSAEVARSMGKNTLVIFNTAPEFYAKVMNYPQMYKPTSPFDTKWPLMNMTNFLAPNIYFVTSQDKISTEPMGDSFSIKFSGSEENIVSVAKKDAYFMGTSNIITSLPNGGPTLERLYYYTFEDFYNSPNYNGLSVTSNVDMYKTNPLHFLGINPLLLIKAGGSGKGVFSPDSSFDSGAESYGIRYGYTGDCAPYNPYDGYSNRHGNNFSYTFTNIPKDEPINLILMIDDIWVKKPYQRVFDIIITTDDSSFTIKNIDTYRLTFDRTSTYNNPALLTVGLPPTTTVSATFKAHPDSLAYGTDFIPFVNIIGLTYDK